MKYAFPLHFHIHEFVMQAGNCKRDNSSAEYSVCVLYWKRAEHLCRKNVETPPIRRLVLQGSHIPHNPINNIMLPEECTKFVRMCVCVCCPLTGMKRPCSVPDFITLYRDMVDGGFPFNLLYIVIWKDRPGGHSEMQASAQVPEHLSNKCHVSLQG